MMTMAEKAPDDWDRPAQQALNRLREHYDDVVVAVTRRNADGSTKTVEYEWHKEEPEDDDD